MGSHSLSKGGDTNLTPFVWTPFVWTPFVLLAVPEALRSKGVLALQASPDLVDVLRRDGRLDPLAVEALARRVLGMQRHEEWGEVHQLRGRKST
jgi:hypothetical protein